MQLQASIKVGSIFPGRNPRGYFDPSEMAELEESVKSKGVLQADGTRSLLVNAVGVRRRKCSGMSMRSRPLFAIWMMARQMRPR